MSLEDEFTAALRGTYEVARERDYIPAYFMQMLEEFGGVETAKRLLAKKEVQTGLFRLWELNLLQELHGSRRAARALSSPLHRQGNRRSPSPPG